MLLDKIKEMYPQFTKSQKRLAEFIANAYREVAFMKASQLAQRLEINESTVVRFAQKLGYPGYPELIQEMRAILQQELKPPSQVEAAQEAGSRFMAVLNNEVAELQRIIGHLPAEAAQQALTLLREAQRIFAIGQGISAPLAQLFCLALRTMGLAAESSVGDPLSLALAAEAVDEHCLVVAVEAATEGPELANALRYAGQKGAKTLALSWSPVSPAAQAAQVTLSYPASTPVNLPPLGLAASIMDALVQSLAAEDAEGLQARRDRLAAAKEAILARRRR